jgi:hypothetical protein
MKKTKKPNTYIDLSKTLKRGEILGGRGVPSRFRMMDGWMDG